MREKLTCFIAASKAFLREKGVYVVVCLSLAAIGAAAWFSAAPMKKEPVPTQPSAAPVSQSTDERLSQLTAAQAPKSFAPVITPIPSPTPSPTPVPDFTQKPKKSAAPKETRKAASPVKGSVIWQFAADELIYSSTLDQWMTHHGVDIGAPVDSKVHTVYAGTVEDVFTDDALGVTVSVLHKDGLRTVYANLQADPPVKAGSLLNAGDPVGTVGSTARSECEAPSHLHFEVWKNDKPVDPADYCLLTA
ncbi:MAG: M23 family metallopeptidase [Eubacteriales bacterium]|nr:M23 family metallopeptidase [Eubacteriales bacterium]